MGNRMQRLAFIFLCSLSMTACQTNDVKEFSKVQSGMEKAEVLEIMGSPQRQERWQGMDLWTYIYYTDSQRHEKEIDFSDGKATYVGESAAAPANTIPSKNDLNQAIKDEYKNSLSTTDQKKKINPTPTDAETEIAPPPKPHFDPVQ